MGVAFEAVGNLIGSVVKGKGPVALLMREQALHPVFQPIADLRAGTIHAHEALIRGADGSGLQAADALFRAARCEGVLHELEIFCMVTALECWGMLNQPGRLFVNISADTLVRMVKYGGVPKLGGYLRQFGILPHMLVLEITEHERVSDMNELACVVHDIHALGASLALDDFGDGHSSLRLWTQIKPDIVKIDKYFTKDISRHADNLKTIQALLQIAEIFGTQLVAEGIEKEDDLRVLRDLGIAFGQGYFLGRPSCDAMTDIFEQAGQVLKDARVAVMPEKRQISRQGHLRNLTVMQAPSVSLETSNNEVAALFGARPELHAVAVVVDERPVAIINRRQFMDHYAVLYFREICGKKSCTMHANFAPRLVERDSDMEPLVGILTAQDQRYLTDGFIVTEHGRYVGLGTGEQLVRAVTEVRLEAARHANPLTFLPGNIPINQHTRRLLESGAGFVACYADLNYFKPFNDHYGYWRGDEMIRLLAKLAQAHCDPRWDFVGHVGGDDFMLLFQSEDWQQRCEQLVSEFNLHSLELYDASARLSGGIHAADRDGLSRFFPFITLSIGAVEIRDQQFRDTEEVAAQAALAKRAAKNAGLGLFVRGRPLRAGSDGLGSFPSFGAMAVA
jgi:diguanylate cyclase (GGDEF)-like protein